MTRKQIPISQLKRSPIRHEELSLSLTARINYLQQALEEVYSQPIEKWLDEFQRDANPESEVVWWERLTRCYLAYTEPKDLSFKQKQAAFKVFSRWGWATTLRVWGWNLSACHREQQKSCWRSWAVESNNVTSAAVSSFSAHPSLAPITYSNRRSAGAL